MKFSFFKILLLVAFLIAIPSIALADPKKEKEKTDVSKEFTIVIDAGHGGNDFGAIDNGAREKDINLAVATKLASLIRKKVKNVNVVMTRSDDRFISLQERANIANRNRGDLFISIHTNSVDKSNPNRTTVAGTSVYALGPEKDGNNLQVAQRENSVIELEDDFHQKYSGFDPSKDESYIIFEMAQKKNLGQSLKFAQLAQKELVSSGRKDRGVKQAGFWVLWATSMPAVLVEMDFICNPTEAKFLNSDDGQNKIANALLKAVQAYVKSYSPLADGSETGSETSVGADAIAVTDLAGVNTLAANSTSVSAKQKTKALATTSSSNLSKGSTARKRRSDSSKRISDSQSYETDAILLKSENAYLATFEAVQEEAPQPIAEETDSKTNKNKNKKKEKKEKLKATKKESPAARSNSVASTSGKTRFVVKSQPVAENAVAVTSNARTEETESSAPTAATAQGSPYQTMQFANASSSSSTVYKILLLTSATPLSNNDASFGGLVPDGVFFENGQYKYTLGSSTSRRDIESRLLDIKSTLPGATIVVRSE